MKTKILLIIAIALTSSVSASPRIISVGEVTIIPQTPNMSDIINISVLGSASTAGSWVEYEEFSQTGTSLLLDLYIDTGNADAMSLWQYSKQLQPLLPADYSLEIRAFEYIDGTFKGSYITSFVVTPEPTSLVLFSLGIPVFRRFTRKVASR